MGNPKKNGVVFRVENGGLRMEQASLSQEVVRDLPAKVVDILEALVERHAVMGCEPRPGDRYLVEFHRNANGDVVPEMDWIPGSSRVAM